MIRPRGYDAPSSLTFPDSLTATGPGPVRAPDHQPDPGGRWDDPVAPPLPGTLVPTRPPRPQAGADRPEHPRVAARRYRDLLGESDAARSRMVERIHASRADQHGLARRHRDAAEEIRARVDSVWAQVSGPLAPYGLGDLDQLRPAPSDVPAILAMAERDFADSLDRPGAESRRPAGRDAHPRALTPGTRHRAVDDGTGRSGAPSLRKAADSPRRGPRRGGGSEQVTPRQARSRQARLKQARSKQATALETAQETTWGVRAPDGSFDPGQASRLAYRLCLEAMTKAAELRAVGRSSSALSVGMVTGLTCALVTALVVAARVILAADAVVCLAAAAVIGGLAVSAGSGAPATAAVRAALLALGSAGAAVLATLRFVPAEPVGMIASLAGLALAIRFGLGFGGAKPTASGGPGRR